MAKSSKPRAQKSTKSKIAKSSSRSRPKAPAAGKSSGMAHESYITGGGKPY